MTDTIQQNVFGEEPAEDYQFEIEGRTIRPFRQLIHSVLDVGTNPEYKLRMNESGWSVQAVDSANVALVSIEMPESAFSRYNIDDSGVVGVSSETFGSLLQHTRYGKSTNDMVTLSGGSAFLCSNVTREIEGVNTTFQERRGLIDPDSVREEPDLPELNFTAEFDLPVRAFIEAVSNCEHKYIDVTTTDEGVQFAASGDVSETAISVACETSGEDVESLYSTHYLEAFANALHVGKVDSIHCKLADKFPMYVEFEREDKYSGTLMVAPRIEA